MQVVLALNAVKKECKDQNITEFIKFIFVLQKSLISNIIKIITYPSKSVIYLL